MSDLYVSGSIGYQWSPQSLKSVMDELPVKLLSYWPPPPKEGREHAAACLGGQMLEEAMEGPEHRLVECFQTPLGLRGFRVD